MSATEHAKRRPPGRAGHGIVQVKPNGCACRPAQCPCRATHGDGDPVHLSRPAMRPPLARAARSQSSPSCSIDRAARATLGRRRRTRRPGLREAGAASGAAAAAGTALRCIAPGPAKGRCSGDAGSPGAAQKAGADRIRGGGSGGVRGSGRNRDRGSLRAREHRVLDMPQCDTPTVIINPQKKTARASKNT